MESFARLKNPLVLLALVLAQTLWLAVQVHRPAAPSAALLGAGRAGGGRPGAGPSPANPPAAGHSSINPPAVALAGPADGNKVSFLRSVTMAVFGPIERAAQVTGSGTRRLWSNYIDLRHTREQDGRLRAEVARLRQEQASFAEDAAEGRRLQRMLDFKQQYIASTVAAQVIGTSGSDHSHVLWIDKGSADGLRPEQPVITPDGAVGKLREVMPHTSQLLLLNDANSGAGVFLSSTRLRGILRGTASGEVVINNLTADDRIKPGEKVITSGGDQVFPRGLPVGVVSSLAPDPQHPPYLLIHIKPDANLHQLEEVLVVTGTVADLPPAAQADAAAAEAAAAENKRASDIVAERLPSVNSPPADTAAAATGTSAAAADAAAQGPGGVPGIPNSGMPKSRPVLHPDRYSPGTAPPASELTPGAAASPQP